MSTQQDKLREIADALRTKEGTTAKIPAAQYAQRILDITTGTGGDSTHKPVVGPLIDERATIFYKGTFESFFYGVEGEVGNMLPLFTGGYGEAGFWSPIIEDMSQWSKNSAAYNAYQIIEYDPITNENMCLYIGGDGYELLYFALPLKKGVKYTLSLEYRTYTDIVGQYAEPYAPFMGFFQYNTSIMNNSVNSYGYKYAATVLPTGPVPEYTKYECSYTPSSNINTAFIGFDMGCTLDGVSTTIYIRNITLTEE